MPSTTSRLTLQEPLASDASTELRTAITNHATTLDDAVLEFSGTASNRSSVVSSPEIGYLYYATDTGQWSIYNGSAWQTLALFSSGTASARPSAGVAGRIYYATDTTTWSIDNGSAWGTVLVAGAWQALTLVHGSAAGGYTPSARLEGDIVRLKGVVNVSTASGFATLPSSLLYPSSSISGLPINNSGGFDVLNVTSGGSISSGSIGSVQLGGVTYSIS